MNNIITFEFSTIINSLNGDNIVNELFENEETNIIKKATPEFIKDLEQNIYTVQKSDKDNLCCCLCMEELKENEKVYKLPCKDTSHYFHINKESNDCECHGIKEWFKENHTCPICRTEFPYEEIKKDPPPEIIDYPIDDVINYYNRDNRDNMFNMFNMVIPLSNINNEQIISPPITNTEILQHSFMNNIINNYIDEEEDRQLQEAIELSLMNNSL